MMDADTEIDPRLKNISPVAAKPTVQGAAGASLVGSGAPLSSTASSSSVHGAAGHRGGSGSEDAQGRGALAQLQTHGVSDHRQHSSGNHANADSPFTSHSTSNTAPPPSVFTPTTPNAPSAPTPSSADGATPTSHSNANHNDDAGSPAAYDENDPNAAGQDPKKPRACESCRGLKVRCEPDPSNPDGPCRRCAKAGRACVVTQPTRKRQKKTDSRVAELEKKIDLLTATLATRGHAGAAAAGGSGASAGSAVAADSNRGWSPSSTAHNFFSRDRDRERPERDARVSTSAHGLGSRIQASPVPGPARDWGGSHGQNRDHTPSSRQASSYAMDLVEKSYAPPPMVMAGQKRKHTETRDSINEDTAVTETPPPALASNSLGHDYSDIVDRGILTFELAVELFTRYVDLMVQHLPGVIFPDGTTAAEIRKTKPILFLAVMSAASTEYPNLQRTLVKELMQVFAEKIIITGEKSMEIVQALQVAVIWYFPPENFEELKFYQLVHIALVMAIDLGLGRKMQGGIGGFKRHMPATWRDHPFKKRPLPDPTSMEARRAWLTCYFLAMNTSMALHRPALARWGPFLTECMDVLQTSPDAAPTDKYLCHLVWTHKLAEEVGIQFSMDDPVAVINISDARTQYALRAFERDLDRYRDAIPPELLQPTLKLSFNVLNLYMHEVATQSEAQEVRLPTLGNPGNLKEAFANNEPMTPAHISAISACLMAIDGIFDVFLNLDIAQIRCLPVFNFVRIAYAVVVLIKMYFAASAPKSELGKVINKDHMKAEQHLEALVAKFRAAAVDDKSRPAAKFLVVLVMLRSWFQRQNQPGGSGQQPGNPSADGDGQRDPQRSGCTKSFVPPFQTPGEGSASVGSSPQQQHQPLQQTQGQLAGGFSANANTGLQLLSEIATNNSPAASTGSGGPVPTWLQPAPSTHQQPFMYDTSGNLGNGPGSSGGAAAGTPSSATNSGADPRPTSGNPFVKHGMGGIAGPQAQNALPWLDAAFMSDFDYGSLGDGFVEAMDLTLAGLSDASLGMGLENGMRYIMADPPWVGMIMGGGGGGGGASGGVAGGYEFPGPGPGAGAGDAPGPGGASGFQYQ